ncbi:MAG TPA: hypothetical protein PK836_03680 [Syntrophales bacterium]|nr:hypothetical protein [Syntrophales bacterium]HOM06805.1 hypothetical protein [Syntrophales bacterium]HON99500.1 hypothetical protein [Syntrophales bacterium]HPC00765.1 hypothetical protein [Syntrophales bacterium]HPQ06037.1 hypothetical protein [Syntrophales bacterium]
MEVFKIGAWIIAADTEEEARLFYRDETGREAPLVVETLSVYEEIAVPGGGSALIRDLMNAVLDERNAWLRMGIPCDLHYPFLLGVRS